MNIDDIQIMDPTQYYYDYKTLKKQTQIVKKGCFSRAKCMDLSLDLWVLERSYREITKYLRQSKEVLVNYVRDLHQTKPGEWYFPWSRPIWHQYLWIRKC